MSRQTVDRRDPGPKVATHHREGEGVTRIPYPIGVRRATVVSRVALTDRIVRVALESPELADLPTFQADDHVKVVFADPDGTRRDPVPRDDALMLRWPHPLPRTRSYTVRRHDLAGRLELDVVVHEAAGAGGTALGSAWARDARPGDPVVVAGPPGATVFPHHRGHHVFALDETALPVIGRWLEEAPEGVCADVLVETGEASDHGYPLASRDGVRVRWSVRGGGGPSLAEAVRGLERPDAFLFAAGEADAVRPLRRAVDEGYAAGVLVTGYWKHGVVDLDDD